METPPINGADAAIVLVIAISGLFAFFRGFVHELLAVVSWIGAGIATLYGFPYAQPEVRKLISVQLIADMTAGVGIFLIVLVALAILTRLVSNRIRNSALGPLDRSLGLLFGFLRGAVLVCMAWLVLLWVLPRQDHPEWIIEAKALPLVERGAATLVELIPERLRGKGTETLGETKDKGEQLLELEQSYKNLMSPSTKGDAQEGEPGYNSRMRDDMQRAVEGITGAEEPAQ